MPDMPIGALVRLHRVERRMGPVSLATHAGITVRYLEMIEADTKTPSLPVLRRLAKVLGVRTSALVGEAPSESSYEGAGDRRLAEIERALFTYRSIGLIEQGTAPELPGLAERVSAAWHAWFTSPIRYTDVLRVLPGLIIDAEHAVHVTGRSSEACRQASETYQLARSVVITVGRMESPVSLIERGRRDTLFDIRKLLAFADSVGIPREALLPLINSTAASIPPTRPGAASSSSRRSPTEDPAALAEAVARLARDPTLAAQLAAVGRATWASRFSARHGAERGCTPE